MLHSFFIQFGRLVPICLVNEYEGTLDHQYKNIEGRLQKVMAKNIRAYILPFIDLSV